jgi:hypothetical protein
MNRTRKTLLTLLASTALFAGGAMAQSPTQSSSASSNSPTNALPSVSFERSSQLRRDYDSIVIKAPLGGDWTLTGSYFNLRDDIGSIKYLGAGVDGRFGKYSLSASVSVPQRSTGTGNGATLASILVRRPVGGLLLGLQLTGGDAARFARLTAQRGVWSASLFAGQDTVFATKGTPQELLTPLPISRVVGMETLADTQVTEDTVEKRVLGGSIAYASPRSGMSLLYRQGTQGLIFIPDDSFSTLEARASYNGQAFTGRLEADVRKTAASQYADAWYQERALLDTQMRGPRVKLGFGAYQNGAGASMSDAMAYSDAFGGGLSASVRLGERWYGLAALLDHEEMLVHDVARLAFTLGDGTRQYLLGARSDSYKYAPEQRRANGGFIGYKGPLGPMTVDTTLGAADGKAYGTLNFVFRR